MIVMAMMPFLTYAQESSIGLRIGEPFSITYKTFLDDHISLEGLIGRAGVNSGFYYQRAFENNLPNSNAFYYGHNTSNSFSFNLRSAYHEDITDLFNIEQGYLLGYAGLGAQLRSVRVNYSYTDGASPQQVFLRETRNNIDFGPEIFSGGEYYFDELPINVFAEVGLFMELVNRFGHFRLQGAVGVRYIF